MSFSASSAPLRSCLSTLDARARLRYDPRGILPIIIVKIGPVSRKQPTRMSKRRDTYYLLSLGCAKNTVDSESMAALLDEARLRGTMSPAVGLY